MPPRLIKTLKLIELHRKELKSCGVKKIGVFGSVASGTATSSSDVDVLVELEKKSFDAYMDVKHLLEDLTRRPIDLVLASAIKPSLRKTILKQAVYAPGF